MSNPLTLVRDNPLTLQVGATETISASSNLAVTDTDFSDAQLTYTIASGPSDGVLLDNGVAATSFTQADLDSGLVSYHETAPYPQNANTFSDQFVFDVSDPSGNQIDNTAFQIGINPSYPVIESTSVFLTVYAALAAGVSKVQIAYNGYSNEQFSTVLTADTGTLSVSGSSGATVSGSSSSSLSITGTLSQINAALNKLNYINAASGDDTITVTTTDLGDQSSVSKNINVIIKHPGNFTSIDDPAADGGTTVAYGINDEGQLVGSYPNPNFQPFAGSLVSKIAFLYSGGTFTDLNSTNMGGGLGSAFFAQGINDSQEIVGYEATQNHDFVTDQAFIYSASTLTFYSESNQAQTLFESINNQNEIVGYFTVGTDSSAVAFIYVDGVYHSFGPEGAMPSGINNGGEVVGSYNDQGFIYDSGTFSTFAVPSASATFAKGINDSNVIVGYYTGSNGTNGFAYNQDTGAWTYVNVPDATATFIYGINNSNQIVGEYFDVSGNSHAFVGTLPPPYPANGGNNDEWILSNGKWLASAAPGSHPSGYQVAAVGDFTDSGTDGILWCNASTGDADEWKISYGAWAGSVDLGSHPGNYQIAGVGDFTGNGTDDVLWTSVSGNGQVQTDIWELSNGQWAASVSPGSHPSGYQVAGVGDFTGNGTSDLLWQNPTTGDVDEWQLSNGKWAASVDLGVHPGTGWQIAGIGSFTGNGIDDVLWTSVNRDGTVATDIWELGSNGKWANSVSLGNHPAGYQVVGIGDFTGNGTSDILWQNTTTGDVDEWLINNGKWAGSVDLGTHPGSFQVAGIGDFTGTGTSDILWHSPS